MISAIRHDLRTEISHGLSERTNKELDHLIEQINAAGFQEWERLPWSNISNGSNC